MAVDISESPMVLKSGGEFKVIQADLILSNGKVVGLDKSIMGLTIFEGINQIALTGNMMIQDAFNLASFGPIIGQEYLKLKIATPGLQGSADHSLDYSENAFMVTSINDRVDIGNGVQASSISFCSREFIANQRTRISRKMTGTYSEIVEAILRTDLDSTKKFHNEPSVDNKKITVPNITPFDMISIAVKNGISEKHNDPTYFFWENTRGYNFRTLGHMYSRPPVMNYEYTVPGTRTEDGVKNIMQELSAIESYRITGSPDTVYNYTTGIYSSDLIVHDILYKKHYSYTYNYINNFIDERHLGENPLVNSLSVTQDGKKVSSFPARQYLKPTVGLGIDESYEDEYNQYSFTSNRLPPSIQSRNAQLSMLEGGLQMNIDVVGTTAVKAGDIVDIKIPSVAAVKSSKNEMFDQLYNGKFLVRTLRHDFDIPNNKHTMSMNVTKDAMNNSLVQSEENFEPKSDAGAQTISENWNDVLA